MAMAQSEKNWRYLALVVVAISFLWILFEMTSEGKSLHDAVAFTIGFLGLPFFISLVVAIGIRLVTKKCCAIYIAFTSTYVFLFFALKVLPLVILPRNILF